MIKYKALYKAMYDDLKDAQMMIDYACDIKREGDETLATELARYAKERLNHLSEFHKIFVAEAEKEPSVDGKTVSKCMWEETHETLIEWKHKLCEKIEKF